MDKEKIMRVIGACGICVTLLVTLLGVYMFVWSLHASTADFAQVLNLSKLATMIWVGLGTVLFIIWCERYRGIC